MSRIWVPKTKILEPRDLLPVPGAGMAGRMKLEGVLSDGRRRLIQDWRPNLITDLGLNLFGVGGVVTYAAVTADATDPAAGDTALTGVLRSSNTVTSSTNSARGSAPYYGYLRKTFSLSPIASNQNVAKVGIGTSSGGNNLWAAMLVKDAGGSPTTITWLAGETLLLTYEARIYPVLSDTPFEVTIGGVTHTGTMRAALVSDSTWGKFPAAGAPKDSEGAFSVTNGSIGSVTSQPGGTSASASTTWSPYVNGTYKVAGQAVFGTSAGNLSGGITAGLLRAAGLCFQFSLSPAIAKTDVHTLSLNYATPTWGRAA